MSVRERGRWAGGRMGVVGGVEASSIGRVKDGGHKWVVGGLKCGHGQGADHGRNIVFRLVLGFSKWRLQS